MNVYELIAESEDTPWIKKTVQATDVENAIVKFRAENADDEWSIMDCRLISKLDIA